MFLFPSTPWCLASEKMIRFVVFTTNTAPASAPHPAASVVAHDPAAEETYIRRTIPPERFHASPESP